MCEGREREIKKKKIDSTSTRGAGSINNMNAILSTLTLASRTCYPQPRRWTPGPAVLVMILAGDDTRTSRDNVERERGKWGCPLVASKFDVREGEKKEG